MEVVKCDRIGDHGESFWFIELSCGHTLKRNRKAVVNSDKISCKKCAEGKSNLQVSVDDHSEYSPMEEIKAVAKISSFFNVRMDQVQLGREMAVIYIDAEEVKRILGQ